MRKPPPKQKGTVDMKFIMDSLPDRGCSSKAIGTVWALSRFQEEEVCCLIWIENMTAVCGAINVSLLHVRKLMIWEKKKSLSEKVYTDSKKAFHERNNIWD